MKFGQVADPSQIDFTLPKDHPQTKFILEQNKKGLDNISIGCAKWNKTDLKGFYPKGTKDELTYYATQFNSIELNATFYGMPTAEQVQTWKEKTPKFQILSEDYQYRFTLPNCEMLNVIL
jgi:hypothetical protein